MFYSCISTFRNQTPSFLRASSTFSQLSPVEESFALAVAAPLYTPSVEDADASVELLNSLWSPHSVPARAYRPVHLQLRALLKFPAWVVPQLPSGRFLKLAVPPATLPVFSSASKLHDWFASHAAQHPSDARAASELAQHHKTLSGQAVVSLLWADAYLRGESFRLDEALVWNPQAQAQHQRCASLSYPGTKFGAHLWDFALAIPTETALAQGIPALQSDLVAALSYPYYLLACNGALDMEKETKMLVVYTAMDLALAGRARFAQSIGKQESDIAVQRINLPNIDASLSSEENRDYHASLVGVSVVYGHAESVDAPLSLRLSAMELRSVIESIQNASNEEDS